MRTDKYYPRSGLLPSGVSVIVYSPSLLELGIDPQPHRTYLVSSPIQALYYTQLIGDAKHPPTLLSSASFTGIAVVGAC